MQFLKKYQRLIVLIVLAVPFFAFGGAKLAGIAQFHASFALLGLPSWFGYFIGACEVLGAIALFVGVLRKWAAYGLSAIAIGALYFHVTHPPIDQGVPALVLLLLAIYVANLKPSVGEADA